MLNGPVFKLCTARTVNDVDSRGAGGARASPEFGGSEKGRSLISAYRSLAITTNTPGFKKLSTALRAICNQEQFIMARVWYADIACGWVIKGPKIC